MKDQNNQKAKISNKNNTGYVFGGLSFIPLIGIGFGVAAIVLGIKYRVKMQAVLGIVGILMTFILYGGLFYFGFVAKYGPYHELKKQLTHQLLNQSRGQILVYKEKYKKLPQKLDAIEGRINDEFIITSDPWMQPFMYIPKKDGSFDLYSIGPDGVKGTTDDIFIK